MYEPLLGAGLVFDFVRLGVEPEEEVVLVGLREVGAIVLLKGVEHGGHAAVEERVAHAGVRHAFGLGVHGVGGDVIAVAVGGSHSVGFESAGVFCEDLDGCRAGYAVLK